MIDGFKWLLDEYLLALLTLIFATLAVAPYLLRVRRKSAQVRKEISEAVKFGLAEPVTLHPKVDHDICIGCGSCIAACPEQKILGLVNEKSTPVYASRCVGHGACERACPTGAIKLVFGTEKRGIDIPEVNPNFETNVERLFIAGELGGMGLIKNAMLQGQEAVQYIAHDFKEAGFPENEDVVDLVIVGAGPTGLAASLQAKQDGLRFITVDQEEEAGGAILSYPRAKVVMTSPLSLPYYGKIKTRLLSKEELLELWRDIIFRTKLEIDTNEKVLSAEKKENHYIVKTSKRVILTRFLLLSTGRRGTPRKLGVKGEKFPKVMYRLLEPEKYAYKNTLVVGGGDSAVEAAIAIASQEGARVTLSYRKDAFSRIKQGNKNMLDELLEQDRLRVILNSNVVEITGSLVILSQYGKDIELQNDYVFIFAGGEMPNEFLKKVGINIVTKYGTS